MRVFKDTELYTLKWLILRCLNFTSKKIVIRELAMSLPAQKKKSPKGQKVN